MKNSAKFTKAWVITKNSLKFRHAGLKMTQGTDAVYTFRTSIAWLYTLLGQYQRARRECEDMLKKKNQMSRQALSDLVVILGVIYMRVNKFKETELYFKDGLKIREKMGDKRSIGACYLDLGVNYERQFNIKLSEKYYSKALKIYEELGYQDSILLTYNNIGALHTNFDLIKAEEYYCKAPKQAKLISARRIIVYLYYNIGVIHHNRLMDDQALMNYNRALKIAKEINYREGIIIINLGLSTFHREKGRIKKGKSHLKAALRLAKELNVKYRTIDCMKEQLEYYLLSKQFRKADTLSKNVFAQLKKERSVNYKIDRLIYRAKTLAGLNKYSETHAYYNKAYNYVKSLSSNRIVGELFYLRGVAYKKEKRRKDALKIFLRAIEIFKAVGNLRYLDKIEQEISATGS